MNIILTVLVTCIVGLSGMLWHTNGELKTARTQLTELRATAKQLDNQLKTAHQLQETRDKEAKNEIATLTAKLANVPVRVRVVTAKAPATETTNSTNCATSEAQADWILPERNSQELKRLIGEMEEINAAYSSCRETLYTSNILLSGDPPLNSGSEFDNIAATFEGVTP